jgi:PEP-CTERM motif
MKKFHPSTLPGYMLAVAGLATLSASAGAGTFAAMTIDGSFADWAGVPAAVTDANEGFSKDINQIFIANDALNVYIRITFNTATNPNIDGGLYLAVDNDSSTVTGYNVYGLAQIGSEAAYQNDFPFEQATGVFNTGAGNVAAITISPYNVSTTSQEFSIPRAAVIDTTSGQLMFPNNSFNFGAYFNDGPNDYSGTASYTFAVPEPGSIGLIGLGLLGTLLHRRRKVGA